MSLRVCIPTAGTGSRLGTLTRHLNKSLVALAHRPILSHLIEQFPDDTEFVIALGHQGHLLREFLGLAYPNRTFFFAEVSPYEGPGSGLGLSLLACKEYLQQPFLFTSCDTLVSDKSWNNGKNWMGYAERDDLAPYRTLKVENDTVNAIAEKGEGSPPTHKPYIGLANIVDYLPFWQAMEQGGQQAIDTGEAHGLRALIERGIEARPFIWHDTGNPPALEQARAAYREENEPTILEKSGEAIWFIGDHVIKYSRDASFITNRVRRAGELRGFVPEITAATPHMYRYAKAQGRVLSETITLPLFEKLLSHSAIFWKKRTLGASEQTQFAAHCRSFYKDKTFERVALFYRNFERQDKGQPINAIAMPTLQTMLEALDWDWLSGGLPGRFHGDFHFENILWSDADQSFTFLDWRQDFSGSLTTGDIYYDFAKLLHGLIVSHPLIAENRFSVHWADDAITFDLHRTYLLVECERAFMRWLAAQGYDARKVRVLTALIFLNIAALHHYPYSLLLFALGKTMLFEETEMR